MKHIFVFSLFVFIPMMVVYIYQRSNERYEGFKWSLSNDIGVAVTFALFIFVLFSKYVAPEFVIAFSNGWGSARFNEYTYTITWFIGLFYLTFPHVSKRYKWPTFPSAMELKSLHDTKWQTVFGLLVVLFSIIKTKNLCCF